MRTPSCVGRRNRVTLVSCIWRSLIRTLLWNWWSVLVGRVTRLNWIRRSRLSSAGEICSVWVSVTSLTCRRGRCCASVNYSGIVSRDWADSGGILSVFSLFRSLRVWYLMRRAEAGTRLLFTMRRVWCRGRPRRGGSLCGCIPMC